MVFLSLSLGAIDFPASCKEMSPQIVAVPRSSSINQSLRATQAVRHPVHLH
jgi:hypothetical protein